MTSVWSESPMLVVSDLDGTLSEIAPRPHLATWVEGAPDVLKRLVALPNVTAAIVTGRSLDDVLERTRGIDPLWLICEHGAVIREPGGAVTRTSLEPDEQAALENTASELEAFDQGVFVERKERGIAIHTRGCPPEVQKEALERVLVLAESTPFVRLDVLRGRQVIEVRPGEPSKRMAVERLIQRVKAQSLIAAGDDAPDLPMLNLVHQVPAGRSYLIRSDEGPLPPAWVHRLPSPRAWVRLLDKLVRYREAFL